LDELFSVDVPSYIVFGGVKNVAKRIEAVEGCFW